jgi:WhiB family transcriptional regulator, redox-sensing transcriptional regulator
MGIEHMISKQDMRDVESLFPVYRDDDTRHDDSYRAHIDTFQVLKDTGPNDGAWKDDGKCKGLPPNMMHSVRNESREGLATSKAICIGCPVTKVCLEFALANNIEEGIYGGTNESERREIRRQRRQKTQQER